jgi:broad specificity phosphatase PhoE
MGFEVIVMRHGRRDERYDSPLVGYDSNGLDQSCPEVWQAVKALVAHDIDQIVTSPYLRTRQTAQLVQYGFLKLTGRYLPLSVDSRIGEYLQRRCSWKLPTNSEFDRETLEHYHHRIPLCRESQELLLRRTYQFYRELKPKTLVITHAGVANLLAGFAGKTVKLDVAQYTVLELEREREVQRVN